MISDPSQLPLRDIHLPELPSWWPPATGWWLTGAVLLLAAASVWLYLRQRRRGRVRRAALAELEQLDRAYRSSGDRRALAAGLSELLRRACLSLYPRESVAALTGEAWLALLREVVPAEVFTGPAARALVQGPYRPEGDREVEVLLRACRQWLRALPAAEART